jgi:hypothetical protein
MAVSRVAAATITELRSDVRRELGDLAVTPGGDTIPAAMRRFSDAEIDRVLNNALIKLQQKIQNRHPGESLVAVALSYTETSSTSPPGQDLPAGVDANAVFKVEDLGRESGIAIPVTNVSLQEIDRYEQRDSATVSRFTEYHYTLVDRGTSHGILIRPFPPAAHPFRVWYVAQPLVYSADGDQPALATRWRELIALWAWLALIGPAQEKATDLQLLRATQAEQDFTSWHTRNRGPQRIRRVERGRW